MEVPGSAPGSNPTIPRRVYHHSHLRNLGMVAQAVQKRKQAVVVAILHPIVTRIFPVVIKLS